MRRQDYLLSKVFTPFLIIFFIIGFLSLLFLDIVHEQYQEIRTKEILQNIQSIYKNKLKDNNKIYKEILYKVSNDKNIKELFLQKDREKLYLYTKKLYERIKKEFQVTHLYFHEANRKVFLRVHNKNKHSDIIDRFTLKKAQETKNVFWGIEFGIHHNLTSRYVSPYYDNGKLIGYLEIGEEIDYFSPYLSEILNAEIFIAIKKEIMDMKNIKFTTKLKRKIENYPRSKDYYIISTSSNLLSKDVIKLIDNEKNQSFLKNYEIGMIKLYDVQDTEVGVLIALINSENNKANLNKLKITLNILLFVIAIFLILIYYLYLKKTTEKLKKYTKNIIKLTNTDQLTGLYNRRYFKKNASIELKKAIRYNKSISFFMIDIDYFKLYNDTYGHLEGDVVIKSVARIITKSLRRSSDMAFRMGGEEFGIFIIEDNNNISALNIANKILNEVNDLNIEHKKSSYKKITISVGISIKQAHKDLKLISLYKKADEALYLAKKRGRNKIEFYKN